MPEEKTPDSLDKLKDQQNDLNKEPASEIKSSIEILDKKMSFFGNALERAYEPNVVTNNESEQAKKLDGLPENSETNTIQEKIGEVDKEIDKTKVDAENKINAIKTGQKFNPLVGGEIKTGADLIVGEAPSKNPENSI